MEILNLKDSVEKDVFFRKLPTLADQLPRPIVAKKVPTLTSLHHSFVLFRFTSLRFNSLLKAWKSFC